MAGSTSLVPSVPVGTQTLRRGGTRTQNCFPESSRLLTSQVKSRRRCSLGGFLATAPSPSHRSGASLPRGTAWTPREQLLWCGADMGPCSTCTRKHCPAASQRWSLEGPWHKWAGLKRGVRHLPRSPRPTFGVCWALVVSGLGSPRAGAAFASKSCVGEEDPRHALNDGLSDHMKQNTHRECPVLPDNRIVRSPVQDAATPPANVLGDPLPGVPRPCWAGGSCSQHQLCLSPDVHTQPLTNAPPAPPFTLCRWTHGCPEVCLS